MKIYDHQAIEPKTDREDIKIIPFFVLHSLLRNNTKENFSEASELY